MSGAQRIIVVGTSCSGKSTLAGEIAGALGYRHIELDALYWLPDWQERDRDEFRAMVSEQVAADEWVLAGNYRRLAQDIVWSRGTHLVWLNYSFPLVMQRALRRTLGRALSRKELWPGVRESFRTSFMSRDSILLWVIKTFAKNRAEYRAIFDDRAKWPHLNRVELSHPEQARALVRGMASRD